MAQAYDLGSDRSPEKSTLSIQGHYFPMTILEPDLSH